MEGKKSKQKLTKVKTDVNDAGPEQSVSKPKRKIKFKILFAGFMCCESSKFTEIIREVKI